MNCPEGRIPSSNTKFWNDKLERNIQRDIENIEKLEQKGWKILVIWECEIEKQMDRVLESILTGFLK